MLKKIGIFVEGQTEQIFLDYFIGVYLGHQKINKEICKVDGKNLRVIRSASFEQPSHEFYFLIVDVGNGETVLSVILEQVDELIRSGFEAIIALRDLHPYEIKDKSQVIESSSNAIKTSIHAKKIKHVLAVNEIESWFLADYNVFSRINKELEVGNIKKNTGIDLIKDNPETYYAPNKYIDKILKCINESYSKKEHEIHRIVSRLDFDRLCSDESLKRLDCSFAYFIKCLNMAIS